MIAPVVCRAGLDRCRQRQVTNATTCRVRVEGRAVAIGVGRPDSAAIILDGIKISVLSVS